jgi:hypothetical protein
MRKLLNHTRHWIFPRRLSRRGSILIMVVAVLVLLALMGTAYISTVRLDRQSGAPLLEASPEDVLKELANEVVPQMAEEVILKDVQTTTGYRPAEEPVPATYDNWDYASPNWWRTTPPPWVWEFQNDAWLADRFPQLVPATGIPGRGDIWVWRSLSRPLDQPDPATATSQKMFESPYMLPPGTPMTGFLSTYPLYSQDQDPAGAPPNVQRVYFVPSELTISYPYNYSTANLQNKTRVFPALIPFDATAAAVLTNASGDPVKLLAADADGDGIADAGLWPITEVGGIKYYAAIRIIDNSSAINVNTARSRTGEFANNGAGPTAPISAIFPSNIGMFELFAIPVAQQAATLNAINQYEFNIMANPASTAAAPFEGTDATATSTPRTDFAYATQGEAQYFAITSRLNNPGFRAVGPPAEPDTRVYKPFKLDENGDLLYRFGMINPNSLIPTSTLDFKLYSTLPAMAPPDQRDPIYHGAPNYTPYPYPPPANPAAAETASLDSRFKFFPNNRTGPANQFWNGTIDYWFEYSYDFTPATRAAFFGGGPPTLPVRSLLTTSNAVSNLISGHIQGAGGNVPNEAMLPYGCKGRWNTTYQYVAEDIVYYTVPYTAPASPRTKIYICLTPNANVPPETAGGAVAAQWLPYNPRGIWSLIVAGTAPGYLAGDVVRYTATPAAGDWKIYLAMADPGVTAPDVVGGGWVQVPGYIAPPKASLNTATFAELFRAFWNVMATPKLGGEGGTPFDAEMTADMTVATDTATAKNVGFGPPTFNNPYVGMGFHAQEFNRATTPSWPDPFSEVRAGDPGVGVLPLQHPLRMFRSPLRAVPETNIRATMFSDTTPRLTPHSVMLLRAAIAAVNAEDLRDEDNDVTARKITLEVRQGAMTFEVEAVVYGTEAQPFITEVYANTDRSIDGNGGANPNGYVAVELHNPFPFDIRLTNWRIAVLNRNPPAGGGTYIGATPGMALTGAAEQIHDFGNTALTPIVPAFGYLLLENYDPTGTGVGIATVRPASTGLPPVGPIPNATAGNTPNTVNYPGNTTPRATTPPSPQLNVQYVPFSQPAGAPPLRVFNREMVILKPRRFDGVLSNLAVPEIGFTSETLGNYLQDFIPVDSYDFTGLVIPTELGPDGVAETTARAWHYMRASRLDALTPVKSKAWHFVYPGRYDASNTIPNPAAVPPTRRARQAGTREALRDSVAYVGWPEGELPTPTTGDPWNNAGARAATLIGPEMSLGMTYGLAASDCSSVLATYPVTFPIQLAFNNFYMAAGAPPIAGSSIGHQQVYPTAPMPYQFPFGGFSRTGDVLYVPFIGAYRIKYVAGGVLDPNVLELNSVTMDAAMAEDTVYGDNVTIYTSGTTAQPGDDPQYDLTVVGATSGNVTNNTRAYNEYLEQLGRFCPPPRPSAPTAGPPYVSPMSAYEWAYDVLDYFTAIQNSHDDFIPNADPARYLGIVPSAVANTLGVKANSDEDWGSGTQGLINVNTASWKALSMVPMVVADTGVVDVAQNEALAQAIVNYRDVDGDNVAGPPFVPHGPFKNLFELNDVVVPGSANGFLNFMNLLPPPTAGAEDIDDGQGDFTPHLASYTNVNGIQDVTDGVRFDFEERNLNVMRLSNLLTTRSDTFTAYILVQGWKNTGTATPELVAERRSAFTIDRNEVGTTGGTIKKVTAPTR